MKRSITYFFKVILIWVNISLKFAFCVTMTNCSSWQNIMPLYDSSEVFVPAKQYWNTIHSPWIIKRLNDVLCTLVYFRLHVHELSLFKRLISMHNNPPYPYINTLWFIHINTVFSPHIYCIRSYSKHLYENKGHVSHDMSIMFRDQSIMGFPQVPILRWLQFIYQSNRSFNIPPPPGNPPGIWLFGKLLFKSPLPKPKCRSNVPH